MRVKIRNPERNKISGKQTVVFAAVHTHTHIHDTLYTSSSHVTCTWLRTESFIGTFLLVIVSVVMNDQLCFYNFCIKIIEFRHKN